ncbi:MAG: 30S ribosome-binding factor RbfA [Deltaproteobacteria bacterium]|nr:30S ribosome-binding factor RbfA [Deltaproteobacteria bacterium]
MQVGEQLREIISELVIKKIKDPRLAMVTITEVEMTSDLKTAFVYFSFHNPNLTKDQALQGFNSAAGLIKREMGHNLKLRYVPELIFKYDSSFEYGHRIEKILADINMSQSSQDDKAQDDTDRPQPQDDAD